LTDVRDGFSHLLQDLVANFGVHDLTTTEHDRDAALVALFDELAEVAELGVKVMLARLGTELDLFDLDDGLLLFELRGLALLLILELAVVHDLADRWTRHGLHFDEVEPALFGAAQ